METDGNRWPRESKRNSRQQSLVISILFWGLFMEIQGLFMEIKGDFMDILWRCFGDTMRIQLE
jgi:hypothetical protein